MSKLPLSQSGARYLLLSILIVIIDQVCKYLCVTYIERGTMGISVTPFFNLVHVYNHGAAFSFLAEMGGWQRWFFAGIAMVIGLCFVVLMLRTPKSHRLTCSAFALFVGGAAGNLIDRVHLGYVIDFLLFYIKGDGFFWAYPAFNIADIAVCVGAALLILLSLFGKHEHGKKQEPKRNTDELPRV